SEIARAMASSRISEGRSGAEAGVVGLEAERERRRPERIRRVLIGAAAAVGVLALAGGVLSLADDDGDSTDQAATLEADDAPAEAGAAAVPELDLGEIDDPDTLALAVVDQSGLPSERDGTGFENAPGASAPGVEAAEPDAVQGEEAETADDASGDDGARSVEDCAIELIESRPSLIGQLTQGTVIYQGIDAYVFVYNDADAGGAVTIVTATQDCRVLEDVPL
ncbi:MAG: hypothetical protein AAGK32_17150, partial [Actinomycetota bacterium]